MVKLMGRIAKRSISVNYVTFIAGIQISACVKLFTDTYFRDMSPPQFFCVVMAGLLLGISSLLSLVLGSEIDYIARYGELAIGTTLEKRKCLLMDERLNEIVSLSFLGKMKRINRMRVLLYTDSSLTLLSLGILFVGKM